VGLVSLRDLIDFISHVADCYPEITNGFSRELIELLTAHHEVLEPELREKVVGALGILRKKGLIDSVSYVPHCRIQSLYRLTVDADYCKHSSLFSSLRTARPFVLSSSRKSSLIYEIPIRKQRTTSSIGRYKRYSTTSLSQTVRLRRDCGL